MWIMEVLELRMAGMPEQSFKLILDAGPAHEQCTDIFQNIIQRTAIWQQVATRINEGTDPRFRRHWYTEKQDNGCFVLDGFPEAVQDLVNGHCRSIETTFNIGPMLWDVDTEFRKYSYMDGLQFAEFTLSKAEHIEPVSPFPRFLDLLAEHILPQYWEEREYKTVPVYEYEDLELDWISPSNHDDVNANNGEPANEQHTLDNGSATSYASNSASSEDGVQTDNSPSSHPNEEMAREVDAGSDDLADGNVLHEKEEATGDDVDKELSPSLPDMVQQMTLGGPIEGPVPTNQPGNTV
ncbi:hypothetical protein B0I35DRAFT_157520 [Stachybotrys elegans]|uniref:Uncharacterized protein n=1 Tax=Stachybotrys elegans TaxID=80388 RepID=A0A8K0WTZ8_9HYPO|nr:hypothetical protein B0I35DRAFT_157520 [Stachybotrys elegans]